MLMIPFQSFADDYLRGDCTEDGKVDIDDVTALIGYILNGKWPEQIDPEKPETKTFTVGNVSFTMVLVEAGTFRMGANDDDTQARENEKPAHNVTITKDYYIGETEVTRYLWQAVMGSIYNLSGNMNRPMELVDWNQCQAFITKLNELTGEVFRFPTEAEWEFAARGGNKSKGYLYSGSNVFNEIGWCVDNTNTQTQPVATKAPNELGLYDMSGNVSEWCQDWLGDYSSEPQIDPVGPSTGSFRVLRGGDEFDHMRNCRVSCRQGGYQTHPTFAKDGKGLRIVLEIQ